MQYVNIVIINVVNIYQIKVNFLRTKLSEFRKVFYNLIAITCFYKRSGVCPTRCTRMIYGGIVISSSKCTRARKRHASCRDRLLRCGKESQDNTERLSEWTKALIFLHSLYVTQPRSLHRSAHVARIRIYRALNRSMYSRFKRRN